MVAAVYCLFNLMKKWPHFDFSLCSVEFKGLKKCKNVIVFIYVDGTQNSDANTSMCALQNT